MNVPKLRFNDFVDNWNQHSIDDISHNITAGATPSTINKDYWGGNIRWMNSGELNLKKVFEVENRITELGLKKSSTKLLPKKCVLIGLAGQGKTRGTVAMNMVELCTNQSIAAIHPNCDKFNEDFLYHNLDYRYEELRGLSTGDGGRGGLNLQIIKSMTIFLPSLKEQTKIANFLTAVDEKISQLTQKHDLLTQYKKGVMQQIFSQELRFKDDDGQDFPEWEEKEVGDVFRVTRGNVLAMPLVSETKTDTHQFPVYSSQTKNNGLSGYYNEYIYENSITWTTDGANAGDVNFRAGKFYCTNVCGVLISEDGHANACIASMINAVSRKYVSYVGNPKLMNGVMAKIAIEFPCVKEQTKIANFLTAIDDKITAIQTQLQAVKQYKQGLLQQMFA